MNKRPEHVLGFARAGACHEWYHNSGVPVTVREEDLLRECLKWRDEAARLQTLLDLRAPRAAAKGEG